MLDTLLIILSIYGLIFLVTQSDGPWGIMNWFRNKLINNKFTGLFFYKLFSCWFCSGCWSGGIIYLLDNKCQHWNIFSFCIWFLAGGSIGYLGNLLVDKYLNFNES